MQPKTPAISAEYIPPTHHISHVLMHTCIHYTQPKASSVSVVYSPAAVAAGMQVTVEVEISCTASGKIDDELHVSRLLVL